MGSQFILKQRLGDQVELITINHPEKTNKLSEALMDELVETLLKAEADQDCRVVILTANGEYFCNGGDLGDFRAKSPMEIRAFGKSFIKLHTTIGELAKPVIAAVQGHAHGGGFGLVEICDLAIAAEEATFAVPEIMSGLVPMMALTGVSRVVSRKKTMELAMLGEVFTARQALENGIINRICKKEDLLDQTVSLAQKISAANPSAIALLKDLYRGIDSLPYQMQLERGLDVLISLLKTLDVSEALTAYQEKRSPVWKGK